MKILILNQAFYPDVASTAQHASDLAVALVTRGHEVTVVCGRRAYDNPRLRYRRNETWLGVRIRRVSSSGFGKKARWRRAADFGSYLLNCAGHLALLRRVDLVIAMTSPPLISWLGAWFARLRGGRFVFWVMDLNPDEALAAGWLRPNSWTTRRLQDMLRFSLHQAERVVVLDRFMAARVEAKGIARSKVVVVPPWSHDHAVRYDSEARARFRRQHGLDGKFVVMYSGNHSPCHPLTTLLEAARRLGNRREIAFCFIGGGSEFQRVERFAKQHRLGNIVTLPYQPLDSLGASLSSADLHTVVLGDAFVGIVHPCKVYNIRTLGIPYLYIGPTESHISDLRPPFTARHGDVDAVVQHIQRGVSAKTIEPCAPSENDHGQDRLVVKMVLTLEESTSTAAARYPRQEAA